MYRTNSEDQEIAYPITLQRKVITTADGSKTIQIEEWNEQYHSIHGALQEANYVYIRQGLLHYVEFLQKKDNSFISLLEIGFGTGLNASLSMQNAEKLKLDIQYVGVEAYPVNSDELFDLNYPEILQLDNEIFENLHNCEWEVFHQITPNFELKKQQKFFHEITDENCYDIIYFDAFGARVQPELWTEAIFKLMYQALKQNGVLVTYSAKGSVRRSLIVVGFMVERLPGPPGKRHMLRAIKR